MRPTFFSLLPHYDWDVTIVSSTVSPSMSYVSCFRAFPAVVCVDLFLTSNSDVVCFDTVELLSVFRISALTSLKKLTDV